MVGLLAFALESLDADRTLLFVGLCLFHGVLQLFGDGLANSLMSGAFLAFACTLGFTFRALCMRGALLALGASFEVSGYEISITPYNSRSAGLTATGSAYVWDVELNFIQLGLSVVLKDNSVQLLKLAVLVICKAMSISPSYRRVERV